MEYYEYIFVGVVLQFKGCVVDVTEDKAGSCARGDEAANFISAPQAAKPLCPLHFKRLTSNDRARRPHR